MPRNSSEGDLPKIAIATGENDLMECVLRKMGIADTEFTDPTSTGSVVLYKDTGSVVDAHTPAATALYGSGTSSGAWSDYDEVLLPCNGSAITPARTAAEQANLLDYANQGGRVLISHFGYTWLDQNGPLSTTATWNSSDTQFASAPFQVQQPPDGPPQILTDWMDLLGLLSNLNPPELVLKVVRHDVNSVSSDSLAWIAGTDPTNNTAMVPMYSFDTPVTDSNRIGRVIYDDFHVEDTANSSGKTFPNECGTAADLTPQEKLFEYSMYNLDACISP
jgi:hypothetical protein